MTTHLLAHLSVDDLLQVAVALRGAEVGADSMEDVARRVVTILDDCLVDADGDPACALVRFYVTHRFGGLDDELRTAGLAATAPELRDAVGAETRCFTLLASAGRQPAWRDRRLSIGHRAIPLVSEELVLQLPMLVGLLSDLGLEVASVVRPSDDDRMQRHHRRYDVFYVPDAETSEFVPAKDFVRAHGVRSAVGVGGIMPSGELFCVLLFARVSIPERVVELLGTLAVTIKAGITPYTFRVFSGGTDRTERR